LQVYSTFAKRAAIEVIKSEFLSLFCFGGRGIFLLLTGCFFKPLSLSLEGVLISWYECIPSIGP
jgi:hypothetical protein